MKPFDIPYSGTHPRSFPNSHLVLLPRLVIIVVLTAALFAIGSAGQAMSLTERPTGNMADSEGPGLGHETGPDARAMLNKFRDYYYSKKQIRLNVEMLLREKYLLGLFQAINAEMKHRRGKAYIFYDVRNMLSASDYGEPPQVDTSLSIADRYLAESDYIRAEYHHKLIYAEAIKKKLLQEGSPEDIKRMFDYDLVLANKAYMDYDFPLAILRFEHILSLYPYSNVDDILFYKGEAEYGARYYVSASQTFERLINDYPDSPYFADALARLFYVYSRLDEFRIIESLWDVYGSKDLGFGPIMDFDRRWNELTDMLSSGKLDKEDIRRIKEEMRNMESGVNFSDDDVFHASKLYYAAGLGLYFGGAYEKAHDAFSRLPRYTPDEWKASYLDGLALISLKRYDEALAPLERIAEVRVADTAPEHYLADDAKVKLGYIYVELGDFDKGMAWLDRVRANSYSYKDALVGKAWVEYRRNNFAGADSLTKLVAEKFPDDTRFYEARSLEAMSLEMLGKRDDAQGLYLGIFDSLDKMLDLKKYIRERKIIANRLKEAKQLEERVVEENDPDLFVAYMNLLVELDRLYQRVKMSEAVALNDKVQDFLNEQEKVRELNEDASTLQADLDLEENRALKSSYDRLERRLQDLAMMIRMGALSEEAKAKVAIQPPEVENHNRSADSLMTEGMSELKQIQQTLRDLREAREGLNETDQLSQLIRIDIAETELDGSRQSFEEGIVSLSESKMTEITADIETWRDFATRRYALADLDFDYLLEQMNLLNDLNKRIAGINRMIKMEEGATGAVSGSPLEQQHSPVDNGQ